MNGVIHWTNIVLISIHLSVDSSPNTYPLDDLYTVESTIWLLKNSGQHVYSVVKKPVLHFLKRYSVIEALSGLCS